MGSGQHGQVARLPRQPVDSFDEALHFGFERLARGLEHQRVGKIVDVFGGAGEVDELDVRRQPLDPADALLDEVLHRLHVVIGGGLQDLDPLGVRHGEVGMEGLHRLVDGRRKGRQLRHLGQCRQRGKPLALDLNAEADQAVFAEYGRQRLGLGSVASVDGANGGKQVQGPDHASFLLSASMLASALRRPTISCQRRPPSCRHNQAKRTAASSSARMRAATWGCFRAFGSPLT